MKRLFALTLTLTLGWTAAAQFRSLKSDIQELLFGLQRDLRDSQASQQDLARARDLLMRAQDILRGQGASSQGQGLAQLTCVSRDNDGMEPFAVAVRDPESFTVTKIPGLVMKKADCQNSIQRARSVRGAVVLCASRDSDGMAPFNLVAFSLDSKQAQKVGVQKTLNECFDALGSALVSRTSLAFCGSRDNDGLAPFTQWILSLRDGRVTTSGVTYRTLQECRGGN